MILQVLTLMPIRTVMNYQYRYGTTMTEATKTLYADGGWTRYYQGLTAALVQGPVARFGDTAANVGILALLKSNTYMKKLPSLVQTVFASLAAAAFRMILTPIDTVKTTMQTDGKAGMKILRSRVRYFWVAESPYIDSKGTDQEIRYWYLVVWGIRYCCSHFCWTLPGNLNRLLRKYSRSFNVSSVVRHVQLPARPYRRTRRYSRATFASSLHRFLRLCRVRHRIQLVACRQDVQTST